MNRQRWLMLGGLVALVLFVCVAFIVRKRRFERAHPSWLDPQQPPEGVAAQMTTLTPGESLAANGCWPMSAPCTGRTARLDTMRTYPGHLTDHPGSLIHALVQVEL